MKLDKIKEICTAKGYEVREVSKERVDIIDKSMCSQLGTTTKITEEELQVKLDNWQRDIRREGYEGF